LGENKWRGDNGKSVMGERDQRVRGSLTRRLIGLAEDIMEPEDVLDPDTVPIENPGGWEMPDCANCVDRCCIHKGRKQGILLSLQDVAHLVDSGLEDLIVGTFTFKHRNGEYLPEVKEMPRLAKRQGYCVFYDPDAGMCNGYAFRPTICRRYPYEVEYRRGSGRPFARYIPDAPCAKTRGKKYEPAIREMVREAVIDENISLEDSVLLPEHHEELRAMGFDRWLPPPEECPPVDEHDDDEDDDD